MQRFIEAFVEVACSTIGQIESGLMILICAMGGDGSAHVDKMADKLTKLRIFPDDAGKMNRSLLDIGGAALLVSQFTLAADLRSGNRPGFSAAAPPEAGECLYLALAEALRARGIPVETGQFGADMQVHLVNDGPVTLWLEI